ncbi:MAG: metal-dependent transcriptional regulator [Proteobacteria bacterium]|nr:metal-dependent transcriptional regulator [Pseudomonadota bacterium]
MLTEKQEEILEAIWVAGEYKDFSVEGIKKRCAVDFSEDDLYILRNKSLIISSVDMIMFSGEGKKIAEAIIRRHRLAEVLVSSILKMKSADMEEVACKVEHSLVPEVEEAICTLLGHPEICPDGKPIPKGKCCVKRLKEISNTVVSLISLKPGEKGKITYIRPGNHSNLHQLMSLGLHPGILVTVHRTSPAFCIKFDNTELAMDELIAKNIFVWRADNSSTE